MTTCSESRHIKSVAIRHAWAARVGHLIAGIGPEHARCRYSNYIPSTDLQAAAKAAVMAYGRGSPWSMVLAGPPGTGKTHLLASMWHHFNVWKARKEISELGTLDDYAGPFGVIATETALEWRWRRATDAQFSRRHDNGESPTDILNELATTVLLIIDDFGIVSPTAAAWHNAMNQILCERYRSGHHTVLSTNLRSREVAGIYGAHGERIASRLSAGQCLRLDGPDRRRVA